LTQEAVLSLTAQHAACETYILPTGGRCLYAQILRELGHPLPKCWYRSTLQLWCGNL